MRLDRKRTSCGWTTRTFERLTPVELLPILTDKPDKILTSHTAHASRISDVHRTQSATRHSTEMLSRLRKEHVLPHPRRLNCRHHAPRGSAIDTDVRFDHRRCGDGRKNTDEKQKWFHEMDSD